jgi:glycopeptide antibiotics resistance protein
MHAIQYFLNSSFSVLVVSLLVSTGVFLVRTGRKHDGQKPVNWIWGLCLTGFILSVTNILWNTVSLAPFFDGFQLYANINLVPVVSIIKMIKTIFTSDPSFFSIINLFGNIGFFIPIGFFLPFISKRFSSFWLATFFGFSFSLLIEVWQLFLPARGTDIDDIILNTLGMIIGYCLFLLVSKIFPKLPQAIRE